MNERWVEKNTDVRRWDCLDYCGSFELTGRAAVALHLCGPFASLKVRRILRKRLALAAWLHRRRGTNPNVTADVVESLRPVTQSTAVFIRIESAWKVGQTFDFDWVYETCETDFRTLWPRNRHVRSTIQKSLRTLRDQKYIDFVDNRGTYRRSR